MIDAESWESAIRDVLLYIITKLLNSLGSTQWGIEYTGPYTVPRLGEVLLLCFCCCIFLSSNTETNNFTAIVKNEAESCLYKFC